MQETSKKQVEATQKIVLFVFSTLRTSNPMTGKLSFGVDAPRMVLESIVLRVTF
jgi:hypothetical protein